MMAHSSKCSIGLVKEEVCHKQTYIKEMGLINVEDIDIQDKQIIIKRSGIQAIIETICFHHKYLLLNKYEFLQKTCCDPFQEHKKSIKGIYYFNFHKVKLMSTLKVFFCVS